MKDFFSAAIFGAELDLVGNQPRLELDREGIGLVSSGLLGFGFDKLVSGI